MPTTEEETARHAVLCANVFGLQTTPPPLYNGSPLRCLPFTGISSASGISVSAGQSVRVMPAAYHYNGAILSQVGSTGAPINASATCTAHVADNATLASWLDVDLTKSGFPLFASTVGRGPQAPAGQLSNGFVIVSATLMENSYIEGCAVGSNEVNNWGIRDATAMDPYPIYLSSGGTDYSLMSRDTNLKTNNSLKYFDIKANVANVFGSLATLKPMFPIATGPNETKTHFWVIPVFGTTKNFCEFTLSTSNNVSKTNARFVTRPGDAGTVTTQNHMVRATTFVVPANQFPIASWDYTLAQGVGNPWFTVNVPFPADADATATNNGIIDISVWLRLNVDGVWLTLTELGKTWQRNFGNGVGYGTYIGDTVLTGQTLAWYATCSPFNPSNDNIHDHTMQFSLWATVVSGTAAPVLTSNSLIFVKQTYLQLPQTLAVTAYAGADGFLVPPFGRTENLLITGSGLNTTATADYGSQQMYSVRPAGCNLQQQALIGMPAIDISCVKGSCQLRLEGALHYNVDAPNNHPNFDQTIHQGTGTKLATDVHEQILSCGGTGSTVEEAIANAKENSLHQFGTHPGVAHAIMSAPVALAVPTIGTRNIVSNMMPHDDFLAHYLPASEVKRQAQFVNNLEQLFKGAMSLRDQQELLKRVNIQTHSFTGPEISEVLRIRKRAREEQ